VAIKVRRDSLGTLAASKTARVFEGRVARVHAPGDALKYRSGNEHRDMAELRKMVEQMPGKPVILLHPKNKKNLKHGGIAHIVGKIMSARIDGEHAVAEFAVHDDRALQAIESGAARELSLGYDVGKLDDNRYQRDVDIDHLAIVPAARCGPTCELRADAEGDESCGCPHKDGDMETENCDGPLTAAARHQLPAGDFAVPAIHALPLEDATHVRDAMARFNQEHFPSPAAKKAAYHHILARAHALGIDAKDFEAKHGSHLDCACTSGCTCKLRAMSYGGGVTSRDQGKTMDEQTKKLIEEAAANKARADQAEKDRDAQKARADKAETKLDAAETAKAKAEGRVESLELDLTKAKADVKAAEDKVANLDSSDEFQERVNERADLLAVAKPILGDETEFSKMSDRDVKAAVVTKLDGREIAKDKHDAYVDALYEGAIERHSKAAKSHSTTRTAIEQKRQDSRSNANSRAPSAQREKAARISMQNRSRRASNGMTSVVDED
jgi:hypothetical protein